MEDETIEQGNGGQPELSELASKTLEAIGLRIRELRKQRSFTLKQLAEVSGLSTSMLSLVERGLASPSIGSLILIADALGTTMADLVPSPRGGDQNIVTRAADARVIETAAHVIRRIMREDSERGVTVAVNQYAPDTGSSAHALHHKGFEYGLVIEGHLTVEVDGVDHTLEVGDLIAYPSNLNHRIWNKGKVVARAVWFNLNGT